MDFRKFTVNGRAYPDESHIPFSVAFPNKQFYQSEEALAVKNFFRFCSLCHKMLVELDYGTPKYSSQSPDEIALVKAAAK